VSPHQAPDPFLVHREPGPAQLVMHPGHPVVAIGGVEDVAHQLDQFILGDLPLGRAGRLPLAPVIEA
jgi:hypothetical protein